METLLILAFVLAALALMALGSAARQRQKAGMPDGRVISSDTGGWKRMEKPLYDAASGLTGKPDYVIEQGGALIPVEVKSGWAPPEPYDSHLLQLAAYCFLIERSTGSRPPRGVLRYRNRTFEIDYTPGLEKQLLGLLDEIRQQRGAPPRSHHEAARCERCGYQAICDQKL